MPTTTCKHEDCKKPAIYGLPDKKICKYCPEHAPSGYVKVKKGICKHDGCHHQSHFGVSGTKIKEYCSKHALQGYVYITNLICAIAGCTTFPSHSKEGTKKREYCGTHAPPGYVNTVRSKCKDADCKKPAYYGIKDGKAEYCKDHALPGHIHLRLRKCIHPDCDNSPSFGMKDSKNPEYCSVHKLPEHIDVTHKRCEHETCGTQATFGPKGTKKRVFCSKHAPPDYEEVGAKKCYDANCTKKPTFGVSGTKTPLSCKDHKLADYVNVVDIHCKGEKCTKQPIYGVKGTKIKEYCKDHKPADYVNVVDKKCHHPGCEKLPTYGKKGMKTKEYCKEHKPIDYVDVANKFCEYNGCVKRAHYNIAGYSTKFCIDHKTVGMVREPTKHEKKEIKLCDYCSMEIDYNKDFCDGCKTYINLGKTVKRQAKELAVKDLLESNSISFTHDMVVTGGCTKKRPDFVMYNEDKVIILEVDEHQHNRKAYSCECEITRMKQIYFDCGSPNLLFIRFNPDEYKDLSSKTQPFDKARHTFLLKYLQHLPDIKGLGVVYLFYDGFDTGNLPEVEAIDPYEKIDNALNLSFINGDAIIKIADPVPLALFAKKEVVDNKKDDDYKESVPRAPVKRGKASKQKSTIITREVRNGVVYTNNKPGIVYVCPEDHE